MKIDPTGKVPIVPERPPVRAAEPTRQGSPADAVELSGGAASAATYRRAPVPDPSPAGSLSEVPMVADARAQKLAEIRSRVESGAYNSREMIEKVVDRLLSSWKLGPSRPDTDA
jgi:hypothetical protein